MNKEISKGWGISSLICGIISITLIMMPYLGLPLAILAVVFAAKQNRIESNAYSKAGLVLGIIGIVLGVIMLLIIIAYITIMPKAISALASI